MKRWIVVGIAMLATRTAKADYVNGAADDVRQAAAVAIGRAQTANEARAWPPPPGRQRVVVLETLVGVWFEQSVIVEGQPLSAGQRAIVLIPPRDLPQHPELAIEPPPARRPARLWALGAGDTLPADVVPEGGDGRVVMRQAATSKPLTLVELRAIAAKVRPREIGITARIVEASLLPRAAGADDTKLAAIYDLMRDVPALAALLEWPAPVRDAAARRLRGITGAIVAAPTRVSPSSLAAWHQRWLGWWVSHRDGLLVGRHYPAVPVPVIPPQVVQPTAMLAAFDGDPARFAASWQAWLDHGLVRDRELRGATTTEIASRWPGADVGGLSYGSVGLPALDELVDRSVPAPRRIAALGALVLHIHAERFAAERALAARRLSALAPCSLEIRDAAYWELVDSYTPGPAHVALTRLAACDDPAAVALLERMYELRPDVPVMTAVAARVAANDRGFIARLVQHIRKTGASTSWAVTIVLAAGDRTVVPIVTRWLAFRDVDARIAGAGALERAVAPEAMPALLAALHAETDDGARGMELAAIARIADQRALDPLLALAKTATTHRNTIANALAKIKDPRALDVLAKLAIDAGTDDLQGAQESVNAFCWISGLCTAHEPSDSPRGSVDPAYIQAGQAVIVRWRAQRRP
ncbi:MAG: hypothetical protein H6Q90_5612 [Deltaproteobacteria bacterium]|nr:hypothetical protein [Deltaproteobacteria bacterium]